MPLLDAAQAQKHVTVNEALARTDALAARQVLSRSLSVPPVSADDGAGYIVGASASEDWAGHDGEIALYLNGGWDFVAPWAGSSVWIVDEALEARYIAGAWVANQLAGSVGGANLFVRVVEIDHELDAAATSTTPNIIPDKAIVVGVTGRVVATITGATSWSLGVAGSADRYGSGYGTAVDAFAHGVTGQPQAYFGATALEISSDGSSFTGGRIRLAVHLLELAPPSIA